MAKISINLVIWNGAKYLPYCIESIKYQTFTDWELNILDNGSSDNSLSYLKEHYPQFKVVTLKENIGFAKGHNKLISWSNSDYIFCLNQDIILDYDFLKNTVEFLETHKDVGAISPKIYRWDFKKLRTSSTSPEPEKALQTIDNGKTNIIDSCGLEIFKNHQVVEIGHGQEDSHEFQNIQEIFGTSGAVPIYRKKALEEIAIENEYFDEDYFSYKEDIDLSFRLQLSGNKIYFVPSAIAYHDRTASNIYGTKNTDITKNRKLKSSFVNKYSYKNHILCIIKNEFTKNLIKYFPNIFWYELKKFIYIIFFERETLLFFINNLKQIRKFIKKRKYTFKNINKIKPEDISKWYKSS
ncbi:MAG: glycosyltransferase [Patescibacteria group bacterium]|nr:glycosyltransferase [Patescibacteria group bacterium]MDD4304819.1 glycosyltransferase [Patescibacteria group bacterium]